MRTAIGTLLAAVLLVTACGKRGDPRPPVPAIPKATSDLVVTQRADKVVLSWSYPSLTTAGRSLTDIRRIHVFRYVEELPVPAAGRDLETILPGDVDPTEPRAVALFSKLPAITPAQFAKLSGRIDSMESANLPAASFGARLMYEDEPPFQSGDGRPVRVTYSVVTEGDDARGDLSNLAIIVPLPVSVAPAALTATGAADGIVLKWDAPTTAAKGSAAPVISGYNIYRATPGAAADAFAVPVNAAPVRDTTYTDAPAYGDYEYYVRSVASASPLIESDPSAAVKQTFRDIVPPPAPASVTVLIETKATRLIWEAPSATDLAGYHIYRREEPYRLKLTDGPARDTQFHDVSVETGITYTYEVTSVDRSGNESEPTRSKPIIVPKGP
ncbi:MAG: hypothetical protein WA208_04785 [Thermoanaerobaculia bacterium]